MQDRNVDRQGKDQFLLLEGIHSSAVNVLPAASYTRIESLSGVPAGDEPNARIANAHFIGIRSRTLDLQAASERGIVVFDAPFFNTRLQAGRQAGAGGQAAA